MEEQGSFKIMTCQPKGAANGNWVKNTEQKCSVGTGNNVKNWENVEAVQGQKLGEKNCSKQIFSCYVCQPSE